MKRLLVTSFVGIGLLGLGAVLAPQTAYAYPTCQQEVNIRCHGYSVGNKPPLNGDYNSPEECVAAETPAQCGTNPYAAMNTRLPDILDRQVRAIVHEG